MPGWAPTIGYIAVAGLALIGTGIALAVRYGSATPRGWRPELEPAEIGILTSERVAILAALTELAMRDAIVVRAGRVHATTVRGQRLTHPFVADVRRALASRAGLPLSAVATVTAGARAALHADLVDRGYLRRRVPGWMTVAPLVAAALGAFGIATGVLTAAVFAMVLICAAVGVILIVSVLQGNSAGRHSGVTVRGDAELRRLRQRYRHLDPHRRPAMNTDTPRETAMGAAVFGPSVVREVAPELYGEFRDIGMRAPARAGAGWARGGAPIIGTGWGSGISTIGAESAGGFGVPSCCGGGGGRDGGGS